MDDQDRWEPYGDPLGLPMVDEPAEPDEIGRLYGPDGELLFVLIQRRPFGFTG
jgi:hypothetical protein